MTRQPISTPGPTFPPFLFAALAAHLLGLWGSLVLPSARTQTPRHAPDLVSTVDAAGTPPLSSQSIEVTVLDATPGKPETERAERHSPDPGAARLAVPARPGSPPRAGLAPIIATGPSMTEPSPTSAEPFDAPASPSPTPLAELPLAQQLPGDPESSDALPFRTSGMPEGSGLSGPGDGTSAASHRPTGAGFGQQTARAVTRARPARLHPESRRCSDLFPYQAGVDHGLVTVQVEVGPRGRPRQVGVLDASPAGEVFSLAARTCAQRLLFAPARDESGAPISSRAVVRLRFART